VRNYWWRGICWLGRWRGWCLCRIAIVAAGWQIHGESTRFSCKLSGEEEACGGVLRICEREQSWHLRMWACAGMQDVGSSPEFHQWIALVFPYTMVCIKTCFDNFDFWVRIKHPLFQEQASIPVVRKFQKSNTHKIYVVRQISYSTELLVCINQLKKQYKQWGEKHSSLLNSLSLKLYLSSSLCSAAHPQLFNVSIYRVSWEQEIMVTMNFHFVLSGMSCSHHVLPLYAKWEMSCSH